jgi:molybdopterin converting factor small subunit
MTTPEWRIRYEINEYPSKFRSMRVRVVAFARLRELLGSGEQTLELPENARVDDAWLALVKYHPAIGKERHATRAARNGRLVGFDEALADGDELALLPPVGGG